MEQENPKSPWYQFNWKRPYIEMSGGLTLEMLGLAVVVRKSFYYYGLVGIGIQIGPFFVDIELFKSED